MSALKNYVNGRTAHPASPKSDDGTATLYHGGLPITFEITTVTPTTAAEWLTLNTKNRPLSRRHVMRYARLMSAGAWQFNAEPIIFAAGGWLMNGQTRLNGCIVAGANFLTLVIRGVPDEAFVSLDNGKPRTAAEVLSLEGRKSTSRLANAARLMLGYEAKRLGNDSTRYENAEVRDLVDRHPGLEAWTARCRRTEAMCSSGVSTFCFYVFSGIDADAAEEFFEDFVTGANLPTTDPVHHLRKRLIENRGSKAKLRAEDIVALFFKAWNHRRTGRPIGQSLRWRSTGPHAESFPVPE